MISFRRLDHGTDRAAVADLLYRARDYYVLWKGRAPDDEDVDDVFVGSPPGCDPAESLRLGIFEDETLSGVAELSFGFPAQNDAYLGLMILAPEARSKGNGAAFLKEVEVLAKAKGADRLYLAVLEKNASGRAFWERMGFVPTGVMRETEENGIAHRIFRLVKVSV